MRAMKICAVSSAMVAVCPVKKLFMLRKLQ